MKKNNPLLQITFILIQLTLTSINISTASNIDNPENLLKSTLWSETSPPKINYDEAYALYVNNSANLPMDIKDIIIQKLQAVCDSSNASPELLGDTACILLMLKERTLSYVALQRLLWHPLTTYQHLEMYKDEIAMIEN
jgi:hypothetical protein